MRHKQRHNKIRITTNRMQQLACQSLSFPNKRSYMILKPRVNQHTKIFMSGNKFHYLSCMTDFKSRNYTRAIVGLRFLNPATEHTWFNHFATALPPAKQEHSTARKTEMQLKIICKSLSTTPYIISNIIDIKQK